MVKIQRRLELKPLQWFKEVQCSSYATDVYEVLTSPTDSSLK